MRTKLEKFDPHFVIRNLKFVIELTAADKMNDLDLVRIAQDSAFPILFPHDLFIQFDRDALIGKLQSLHEFAHRLRFAEFPFFTI